MPENAASHTGLNGMKNLWNLYSQIMRRKDNRFLRDKRLDDPILNLIDSDPEKVEFIHLDKEYKETSSHGFHDSSSFSL